MSGAAAVGSPCTGVTAYTPLAQQADRNSLRTNASESKFCVLRGSYTTSEARVECAKGTPEVSRLVMQ